LLEIALRLLLLWLENLNLEDEGEVEKFMRRVERISKAYNVQELRDVFQERTI
jgi:hypothetical protein